MPEENVKTSDVKPKTDWRIIEVNGLKKRMNTTRLVFLFVLLIDLALILFGFFSRSSLYAIIPTSVFFFIFVITFLIWYSTHCLKFVKAWEEGVVFRLGRILPKVDKGKKVGFLNRFLKYLNPQKPGLVLVFWPFEKLVFVQMWTRAEDIPPKKIITKDTIEASLDILFYWKVIDSYDFVLKAEDPIPMTAEFTWATLRPEVGGRSFFEVYSGMKEINENLMKKLKEAEFIEPQKDKGWGLEIKTVMVQEVIAPPGYSEAMLNLAVATQNAEAVRKTAAGKKDADIMAAEANEFTLRANARGNAEQTKLQVEAFGQDGAKILAATMIAGMVQKGDKFFIDPNAAGVSGLAALVKETLDSVGKKGG